jgi:hypothetical protein
LGEEALPGLEKETVLKLTYNQRIMKLITRISGVTVLLLFLAAVIVSFLGSKSWEPLMAGGMAVLGLAFAPLYFLGHYRDQEVREQKVLHILGFLAAFFIPLGSVLGMFNSPRALLFLGVGIFFLLAGFVPLFLVSVPKGSGKTAATGSMILLLFFILITAGFLGVRVSKDTLDNWAFFSSSSSGTSEFYSELNNDCLKEIRNDSAKAIAVNISEQSDKLVLDLSELRDGFIRELAPSYTPGDKYFRGMDNNFAGSRLLIGQEKTGKVLKEMNAYSDFLNRALSSGGERVRADITRLLTLSEQEGDANLSRQEEILFRDMPAVTDVAIINSLILNVRLAEYKALHFLSDN